MNEVVAKVCRGCGQELPLDRFQKQPRMRDGHLSYCKSCENAKRRVVADQRRRESGQNPEKAHNDALRLEVIRHYAGEHPACACCHKDYLPFLEIDHINQDGAVRKRAGEPRGGPHLWRWLRKNGYPSDFRVLCHACNWAIAHYGSCSCTVQGFV